MGFELSYGDIGILFFLTLGPLKAILPFARGDPRKPASASVAWRAVAIATAIVLGVAFFGPFILPNWHVSPPAIAITCGIILFYRRFGYHADASVLGQPTGRPAVAALWPSPSFP
jgi:small neutral amino acid transporter SnatA (MarC family)